jgi:hypothetical protein
LLRRQRQGREPRLRQGERGGGKRRCEKNMSEQPAPINALATRGGSAAEIIDEMRKKRWCATFWSQ